MSGSQDVQCERWVLTVHNFEQTIKFDDLSEYFGRPAFKIKRVVCGRERTTNGPPHLQGYIEFIRSYRRSHVLRPRETNGMQTLFEIPVSFQNDLKNYII